MSPARRPEHGPAVCRSDGAAGRRRGAAAHAGKLGRREHNRIPPATVADVVAALERRYPPAWAEEWDRVGLVLGEPAAPVRRVACVVDCVPETVAEALAAGADMIVAHHPLLLRGVSSVAADHVQGADRPRADPATTSRCYVAHTNADVADPGVSDALAARFGLTDLRPLHPARPGTPAAGDGRGLGRDRRAAARR